jgi:hypothetical protein
MKHTIGSFKLSTPLTPHIFYTPTHPHSALLIHHIPRVRQFDHGREGKNKSARARNCRYKVRIPPPPPPQQQLAGGANQNIYHFHRSANIQAAFQELNYLDERSPCQHNSRPPRGHKTIERAPIRSTMTTQAQFSKYIMSYQVTVASSGAYDSTMAKSFIIALEGPALMWYSRLPPLSIDLWKSLHDKFLLNIQVYRPETYALAEVSVYKHVTPGF